MSAAQPTAPRPYRGNDGSAVSPSPWSCFVQQSLDLACGYGEETGPRSAAVIRWTALEEAQRALGEFRVLDAERPLFAAAQRLKARPGALAPRELDRLKSDPIYREVRDRYGAV